MQKSLIAAAAFAALALGSTGSANAGVASGLTGIRASTGTEVTQQVHWRHGWHKHRKVRHCVWRHGHRHCWWR